MDENEIWEGLNVLASVCDCEIVDGKLVRKKAIIDDDKLSFLNRTFSKFASFNNFKVKIGEGREPVITIELKGE